MKAVVPLSLRVLTSFSSASDARFDAQNSCRLQSVVCDLDIGVRVVTAHRDQRCLMASTWRPGHHASGRRQQCFAVAPEYIAPTIAINKQNRSDLKWQQIFREQSAADRGGQPDIRNCGRGCGRRCLHEVEMKAVSAIRLPPAQSPIGTRNRRRLRRGSSSSTFSNMITNTTSTMIAPA